MIAKEKKTVKTSITGVGDIEIDILPCGKDWWLSEIEKFITQSNEKFHAITYSKPELKVAIHFQRALQAFVIHIQAGGEEQAANMIRNHFRNWVNSQNGSLIKIISNDGQQSNNDSNSAKGGTSNDRMEAARNW